MGLKPIDTSPSIAQLFAHMDYCRLIFVVEDAPEFAREMRNNKWKAEHDRERLEWMFNDSAAAVRDAVKNWIESGWSRRKYSSSCFSVPSAGLGLIAR